VPSTDSSWRSDAESSILLRAVSQWRDDSTSWFEGSFDRLPETVRVNPLSFEREWIESWLKSIGGSEISWFSGCGSAWEMPFSRGAAEGDSRKILNALHDTGRITRQEAVSMLPVIALAPEPGAVVLDLCASPGSKTTQICEHLGDSGVVIANEVVRGRVNTLVSNIQRHSSRPAVVVQHDGRHIPKVPSRGFDYVLADVPCTGSGTTRKNPEVWKKWLPSSGISMHALQFDLLRRAIAVAKPGGRIVYSTCSLDPIENEAVVSRAISEGLARVIPAGDILPKVPSNPGMTSWPILDDSGVVSEISPELHFLKPTEDGELSSQLEGCLRVWNDSIDGGGFFLAILEKEGGEVRRDFDSKVIVDDRSDPVSTPVPVNETLRSVLCESWGSAPEHIWTRGKSILWSTEEVERIWRAERFRRGGKILIPGDRWRPLKVIHLGLICARIRKGRVERLVSKAARRLSNEISEPFVRVKSSVFHDILLGEEPASEQIGVSAEKKGSFVLIDDDGTCLPVWIGSRVTPMINESEKTVLRATMGLTVSDKEV